MTCTQIGRGSFVCHNRLGRLHVGGRYYWVEYHPYCGPVFYHDAAMTREYQPRRKDPIWPVFQAWLDKGKPQCA